MTKENPPNDGNSPSANPEDEEKYKTQRGYTPRQDWQGAPSYPYNPTADTIGSDNPNSPSYDPEDDLGDPV